jgi:hypothetical protein
VPAHVAQAGTLTSRGRIREDGSVHVAQTDPLSRGKGLREEVTIHVAHMGTLPLEGAWEEGAGGGERRYPSTLHRRAPSSHQESRERKLSPRRRLRKIGSCSSLNSQKEPIPTQSPPSAARKIPRGRARVCRRGARGQRRLANRICESCGRRAARACPSAGPYSGP